MSLFGKEKKNNFLVITGILKMANETIHLS